MYYTEMENAMARYMHTFHQSQMNQGRFCKDMELSIWTSPAYWLSKDKKRGDMCCDTFTYQFYEQNGKYYCRVLQKRAEGKFMESACGVSMTDFSWYTIQVMEPWEYEAESPFESLGKYVSLPLKQSIDVQEYLKIRNVQNMFFERRLHQTEYIFSDKEDVELSIESLNLQNVQGKENIEKALGRWLEKEVYNHHCYVFLGINCMPVIEISDKGDFAEGLFMTQIFQVDAVSEDKRDWKLHRHMGVTKSLFVKEKGNWKIYRMQIHHLIALPDVSYKNDIRFDKMGQSDEPWKIDQPISTNIDEDAAFAIENIVNRWIYGNRTGKMKEFARKYMCNPKNENHMLIRSYGPQTVPQNNFDEILEKLESMDNMYNNRFWSFHSPTTPVIQLNEDGTKGKGTWFDLAATNLRSMTGKAGTPGLVPYMVFVNKYVHQFEKMEDQWYLVDFYNEPLISIPDWALDMDHNKGYITWEDSPQYPELFEFMKG